MIAGGAVVGLTLAGAGFGAWTAAMIGIAEPNARLQRFREAIQAGQILIMADVPALREQEIEEMVAQHFPKADLEGAEPTSPIFPDARQQAGLPTSGGIDALRRAHDRDREPRVERVARTLRRHPPPSRIAQETRVRRA